MDVRGGRLLLVAPSPDLAGGLHSAGHVVTSTGTGTDALASLDRQRFDLIIVDAGVPDLVDLDRACPSLADRPPVLCVTDCESLGQIVPELGSRVEDYVTKPCRVTELLARAQVLLRRKRTERGLRLDEVTCEAWRGDRALGLTAAEFRLLRHLLANAGRVLSKEQLAWQVWDEPRGGNAIERLVSRLRDKVGSPSPIHTRRGFGYLLEA